MTATPSLHQLQQRFSEIVSNETSTFSSSFLALKATESVPLQTRLNIYQYAYWARIEESFEEDFARVLKNLGRKRFREVVRQYIKKNPSRFSSLAEVSAGFPAFLLELGEPILAEVARFEWTLVLCFLTDEPEPSNLAEMAEVAPEEMDSLKFSLAPSLVFFESAYPVHKKKLELPEHTRMVIHRYQGDAVHRVITEKQWVLLKALHSGKALSELSSLQESHNLSEKRVSEWFQSWGGLGIIHRFYR